MDLNVIFGDNVPRLVTFLAETRSSQSLTSTLSDFALGSVNTIQTHYRVVEGQYQNVVTVVGVDQSQGDSVTDTDESFHLGVAEPVPAVSAIAMPKYAWVAATEDSSSEAASSVEFSAPKHRHSVSRQSRSSSPTPLKDAWVDNIFSKYNGLANLPAVESDAALDDTTLSTIVQELSKRKMRRP